MTAQLPHSSSLRCECTLSVVCCIRVTMPHAHSAISSSREYRVVVIEQRMIHIIRLTFERCDTMSCTVHAQQHTFVPCHHPLVTGVVVVDAVETSHRESSGLDHFECCTELMSCAIIEQYSLVKLHCATVPSSDTDTSSSGCLTCTAKSMT